MNALGTTLHGINTVCMAALAVSAIMWEGTSRAKGVDTVVMVIQLVAIVGEWGVVGQNVGRQPYLKPRHSLVVASEPIAARDAQIC